MTQQEFIKMLDDYVVGKCTSTEKEIVEKWCDSMLASDKKSIAYTDEEMERRFETIEALSKNRIFMDASQRKFKRKVFLSVAAVVLISLVCSFVYSIYFSSKDNRLKNNSTAYLIASAPIMNTSAHNITVELADCSRVTLFPNSKLCSVSISDSVRKMRLEGKGFFDVTSAPHCPFIVFTENLITKVVGTSFTINAEKGKETVEVQTGKVSVYPNTKENFLGLPAAHITLTPNHRVHFDPAENRLVTGIVKHPAVIPNLLDSMTKSTSLPSTTRALEMKFRKVSAITILMTLETAYGIKISYDKDLIADCVLTANLKDEDFYTRLQTVCDLIGGKYQVKGNEIVLESPGCK